MSEFNFDAIIFDLDGVITKTAEVHAAAWKKMFDEYLADRATQTGEPFKAFDYIADYLPYVDGKPRYNGVLDFLKSRNIELEFGTSDDDIELETVCGLGNRKNKAFNEVLDRDGVKVFESTVELMHRLKKEGLKLGVASSSKNCRTVLQAAHLIDIVDTIVDGTDSARLGLNGKPQPDIFTTAADNMGVSYHRAVVVEDASSGVTAGKAGNFGFVLGLAREHNVEELYRNGADVVVADIDEIKFEGINQWFADGLLKDSWSITYHEYDVKKEKSRESLLAVGNGYFGNRGAMEEVKADENHYPGTYIASLYNRLESPVGDRMIENEDFVNTPNWTVVEFKINDGEWWDYKTAEFEVYKKHLCLKSGLFTKKLIVKMADGKRFSIESKRVASMAHMHLGAQQYTFTPLNFEGRITFRTGIDGQIQNRGVNRYNSLNQNHLEFVSAETPGDRLLVNVRTRHSKIAVSQAVKHCGTISDTDTKSSFTATIENQGAYALYPVELKSGQSFNIEKILGIYSSHVVKNPDEKAEHLLNSQTSFDAVYNNSKTRWKEIWDEIDIKIEGDRLTQKLLRLHSYHMMLSASEFNVNLDASVTARGLHGEAYRGHIFWDDLFIAPFYNIHYPEVSKSLLMYRYRRLDKARDYAKEYGFKGAMFPWQSGSDGREETQIVHLNPITGEWGEDNSSLQRHVSLAIAYDIYEYFVASNDVDFMENYGTEMFLEICRFWASKAELNEKTGRYSIAKVMGPDEFHEMYPDADEGGLKDNAYTNIMVAWMFDKVKGLLAKMNCTAEEKVLMKINLSYNEMLQWEQIAKNLNLVISEEGIISQYDGYFDLHELDWDAYRSKYGNIYRMDRLLKAEGKSADDFKVAKQADTLMTFFNLEKEEVDKIIENLGYKLPADYLTRNLDYYLARTSHGSSLSRVVHAQLANIINNEKLSWILYQDALGSDYVDIQGGTTGEGIHTGVMASTVMVALTNYGGINLHGEVLKMTPQLPGHWKTMDFKMQFRGVSFHFNLSHGKISVTSDADTLLIVNGKEIELTENSNKIINLVLAQ
jgi:beta-phosphoglucomutase family hydrolase